MTSHQKLLLLLLTLVLLVLSGWQPYDRVTWLLEVAPVLIVVPLLLLSQRGYPSPACSTCASSCTGPC
jgi:putative membrane protein